MWDSFEFVGEVAADFLGLNDSQYQYVIDEYKRREEAVRDRMYFSLVAAGVTCLARTFPQRLRKLNRLRALRAAKENKVLDNMEGGEEGGDLGYMNSESSDSETDGSDNEDTGLLRQQIQSQVDSRP